MSNNKIALFYHEILLTQSPIRGIIYKEKIGEKEIKTWK